MRTAIHDALGACACPVLYTVTCSQDGSTTDLHQDLHSMHVVDPNEVSASQQTPDLDPMLGQCRTILGDGHDYVK